MRGLFWPIHVIGVLHVFNSQPKRPTESAAVARNVAFCARAAHEKNHISMSFGRIAIIFSFAGSTWGVPGACKIWGTKNETRYLWSSPYASPGQLTNVVILLNGAPSNLGLLGFPLALPIRRIGAFVAPDTILFLPQLARRKSIFMLPSAVTLSTTHAPFWIRLLICRKRFLRRRRLFPVVSASAPLRSRLRQTERTITIIISTHTTTLPSSSQQQI